MFSPFDRTRVVVAYGGRAVALVPGTVYAFRRCEEGCDLPFGAALRVESLTLIAPSARWVATSSGLPSEPENPEAPFAFSSTRVAPNGSATVGITLFDAEHGSDPSKAERNPIDGDNPIRHRTYTVDVVWPAGSPPEAMLYRGELVVPR